MESLFSPKAGIFFRLRETVKLLVALLVGTSVPLWAESNLKISGQIFDRNTGQPLGSVTVRIIESGNQTSTDMQGRFTFYDLPEGKYRLVSNPPSYRAETLTVKVSTAGTAEIAFWLEPEPITGPPTIVTADITTEAALEPSLVFTRSDMEKSKNLSIAQFLSHQPGLDIKTGGVYGSTEEVTIRGGAANQTLVLFDGRPLNSNLGGTADLSFVRLANLERIEVYKGSQTARFGPDAVAGVVILTSRKPNPQEHLTPQISYEKGSFGYQSTNFESNLAFVPNASANIFYQNLSNRGDFTYADKNGDYERVNSYVWTNRANGKLSYGNFETAFFWAKARRGLPGALLQLTPNAQEKDERFGITLNRKLYSNRGWFFEPSASWDKLTQSFKLPDGFVKTDTRYKTEKRKLETGAGKRLTNQKYQISFDFLESSLKGEDFIRPSQSLGKTIRRSGGLSAAFDRQVPFKGHLSASASGASRMDWTDFTKPAYSPLLSAALNYDKKIKTRVFGSWGKSFRLPTLDALFWKEDVFAAGNPALLPERAESRETGYRITFPILGKLNWEQNFFHNDLKNLIIWQRRFDGKFIPQNISKAKIFGREEKALWQLSKILELEFNHTQTEPINEEDFVLHQGKQLVFRPRHIYNARIAASYKIATLNLTGRWVSKRFTRAENTKYLPPYETYDAFFALAPKLRKFNWNFSLAIENFTGRQYEILERYPVPWRSFKFSLEIKWRD